MTVHVSVNIRLIVVYTVYLFFTYGDLIYSGWWFGTFLIFHNIWDNPSH